MCTCVNCFFSAPSLQGRWNNLFHWFMGVKTGHSQLREPYSALLLHVQMQDPGRGPVVALPCLNQMASRSHSGVSY